MKLISTFIATSTIFIPQFTVSNHRTKKKKNKYNKIACVHIMKAYRVRGAIALLVLNLGKIRR